MSDLKRININIPMDMYLKVSESKYTLTEAITEGLILLLSGSSSNENDKINQDILNLQESRIKDLQTYNETLIRELEDLKKKEPENKEILLLQESRIKELKDNDGRQQARIEDLKAQIQAIYDQLQTKDEQIKDQNENMHKQAVHIQTLLTKK